MILRQAPLLAFILILSTACTTWRTTNPEKLQSLYTAAVADAEIVTPDEISRDLTPIANWNRDLVWRGQGEEAELRVVTWTSWDGYDEKIGESMQLSREVWATAVPELQDFCRGKRFPRAALRLEQLLGLPPDDGKDRFVELWVRPDDLFRPAPDPEIGDREAQLDDPSSARSQVSEEHRQWIDDLRASSYGEEGYPWTQLGYTYDWGKRRNHVGLSEFVVRGGAIVEVANVLPNAEYCAR